MKQVLFVGLGGAVGSVMRYLIGLINLGNTSAFPYKTLIINVVGAFLIGIISVLAANNADISSDVILFIKVGILGGFTTFSTFALETSELMSNGKTICAVLYVILSILLSLVAVYLAKIIIK